MPELIIFHWHIIIFNFTFIGYLLVIYNLLWDFVYHMQLFKYFVGLLSGLKRIFIHYFATNRQILKKKKKNEDGDKCQ